jgi:hypothetical protein
VLGGCCEGLSSSSDGLPPGSMLQESPLDLCGKQMQIQQHVGVHPARRSRDSSCSTSPQLCVVSLLLVALNVYLSQVRGEQGIRISLVPGCTCTAVQSYS